MRKGLHVDRYPQSVADGGWCSRRVWGAPVSDMYRLKTQVRTRSVPRAAGQKPSVSLSNFLEINNLEVDHGLACAAVCFWAQAVWTAAREVDMRDVWKRQVWEATSWKKVRGPAGTVFCEMKGPWYNAPKLAGAVDGRWKNDYRMKDSCPEDVQKQTLLRRGKGGRRSLSLGS